MLLLDQAHLSLGERHWTFNIGLQPSCTYALIGRSGSGKSTLLNLIGGFIQPDSGDISWQNQSLLQTQPAQRPITTLFQQNNLFEHLSVWQNIALGIAPNLRLSSDNILRVDTVIKHIGLDGYAEKRPPQLSGGEQQRVALARCLLRRKPILLLDEPFSALDATTRKEMIELLHTVISDIQPLVIMITHDEDDAKALDAQILNMQNTAVHLIDGSAAL